MSLASLMILLAPSFSLADGMIAVPPGRFIYETGQRGVIFFEDNVETLFLTSSFKGDAEHFGWLVPTPTKPEVAKGSLELFTALNDLTKLERDVTRSPALGVSPFSFMDATGGVSVLEQKKIDYYDITVLAADDKNALVDWLNNNGYRFPETYSYILDGYIANKWVFTAVKIRQDVDANTLKQNIWDGSLTPLKFTFSTSKPVYPLKISSVVLDPEKVDPNKPNFIDGKVGRAIKLDKGGKLSINYANSDLNRGTIEMWVKSEQLNANIASQFLSIFDNLNRERLFFSGGSGQISLRLLKENGRTAAWSAGSNLSLTDRWIYLAVSWQPGENPKFYLDGQEILVASSNEFILDRGIAPSQGANYPPGFNVTSQIDTIYFGQNGIFISPNSTILLDEVRISSGVRTGQEISDNYNDGSGKKMVSDENTWMNASFENGLEIMVNNRPGRMISYMPGSFSQPAAPIYNYKNYKPSQVGIELYIFTKDKEQSLPGFDTVYANWVSRDQIEKLAYDSKGEPVVKAKNKKYYLTKLTRQMKYSDMSDDLFFRDAEKNSADAAAGNSRAAFFILMGLSSLIIIAIGVIIIKLFNRD